MYLTKEIKADIFKKYGGKDTNTGSTEGQIALFTHRINHLTQHLKKNHKMIFWIKRSMKDPVFHKIKPKNICRCCLISWRKKNRFLILS